MSRESKAAKALSAHLEPGEEVRAVFNAASPGEPAFRSGVTKGLRRAPEGWEAVRCAFVLTDRNVHQVKLTTWWRMKDHMATTPRADLSWVGFTGTTQAAKGGVKVAEAGVVLAGRSLVFDVAFDMRKAFGRWCEQAGMPTG